MKTILMTFALLFGTTGLHATELSEGVLAEQSFSVYFAPPEHRGTSRFQIMQDGEIRSVNNHGQIKSLGHLSPELAQKLSAKIDLIQKDELSAVRPPYCMDAPSYSVAVRQTDGEVYQIMRMAGCREQHSLDPVGKVVAEIVQDLKESIGSLEYKLDRLVE